MIRRFFLATLVSAAGSLAAASAARADAYKIDPAHSSVTFKVKHLFSFVDGRFSDFGGGFDFDGTGYKGGNLDVKIEAKSVNTDNGKRDDHRDARFIFRWRRRPTRCSSRSSITPARRCANGRRRISTRRGYIMCPGICCGAGPSRTGAKPCSARHVPHCSHRRWQGTDAGLARGE